MSIGLPAESVLVRSTSQNGGRPVIGAWPTGVKVPEVTGVAESTVNDHISRMVAKTNARNRIQMAATLLGWSSVRPEHARESARPVSKVRPRERSEETVDQERPRCSWRYHP